MNTKYGGMSRQRYAVFYMKGWRASSRGSYMDEAETRFFYRSRVHPGSPEHEAWEDGWLDNAAGRDKWHLRDCTAHHNQPGGCGVA